MDRIRLRRHSLDGCSPSAASDRTCDPCNDYTRQEISRTFASIRTIRYHANAAALKAALLSLSHT